MPNYKRCHSTAFKINFLNSSYFIFFGSLYYLCCAYKKATSATAPIPILYKYSNGTQLKFVECLVHN